MKKMHGKGKEGFTLIEVIAVLVILAVLAAVAIPRYISLIDDARAQALNGALAAGLSHVSLQYGRLALQTGSEPQMGPLATACGGANAPDSTDYTFTFAASGDVGILVSVAETADSSMSTNRVWTKP